MCRLRVRTLPERSGTWSSVKVGFGGSPSLRLCKKLMSTTTTGYPALPVVDSSAQLKNDVSERVTNARQRTRHSKSWKYAGRPFLCCHLIRLNIALSIWRARRRQLPGRCKRRVVVVTSTHSSLANQEHYMQGNGGVDLMSDLAEPLHRTRTDCTKMKLGLKKQSLARYKFRRHRHGRRWTLH